MAAQRTILPFTSFSTEVQQAYTEDKVAIMQQYGFSPAVIQENALKKLRRTPGTSFSSSSSGPSAPFVAPPPQQQQQIQQIAAESAQLAMGVTPQVYPFTFSPGFADPYNNSNSNIMGGFPHQPMMNDNDLLAPAPAFYPSLPDMMGGYQNPMGYDNLGLGLAPMGFFDEQQLYTMPMPMPMPMPVLPTTPAPFLFGGDGGLQTPVMGYIPTPPIFSGVPQPPITMSTETPLPATDFPLFPAPPPPPAAIDADIDTSGVPPVFIPVASEDETEEQETPPRPEECDEFFNFDEASDEDKDREFAEMLRLAIAELDEQAQAQAGNAGDL